MPLVGEGKDVHVEYHMPENTKKLVTDEFLKEFRDQLFRIHGYYKLDVFAEYSVPVNTGTGGYSAAFFKACMLTESEELYNYSRTLPWYDADLFDGEITDMLIEKHFILGYFADIIEQQLGIKYEDIVTCCDYNRLCTKDMVVELYDAGDLEEHERYRCLYCNDLKNSKDQSLKSTDYYRECLKKQDEYNKAHPVTENVE